LIILLKEVIEGLAYRVVAMVTIYGAQGGFEGVKKNGRV